MPGCRNCGRAAPPTERLCMTCQQLHRGPARQVELLDAEWELTGGASP